MTTYYCQRSDIEAVFGPANVAKWADIENNGDPVAIAARVASAIAWATEEINDKLRGGPYVIPLAGGTVGPALPVTVVDLSANLAGVWLYESRGVQDFSEETGTPYHRLQWNRKRSYDALAEIRANKRQIDCLRTGAGCSAPFAVQDVPPKHGYGYGQLGPFGTPGPNYTG
ncbi:MAG TPA: DUF1320 family protein [Pirellulales bacterium]|nr:DUF1320 family protein [Pirellulales bacterium]